ncbi:hypothetical protein MBFIL_15950 [Methanobrevibacter filiformis]|uniref:Antitoxin n=2 Tax=Methanobrevibacter filiformis TaxID=55758 RepID=A0A165ZND2_9EURY|nr:hypothetical protein MBFIL_15950 [Methanobrevibacter filiformis]
MDQTPNYDVEIDEDTLKYLKKISKKDTKLFDNIMKGITEIQIKPHNSELLKHFYKGSRKKEKLE